MLIFFRNKHMEVKTLFDSCFLELLVISWMYWSSPEMRGLSRSSISIEVRAVHTIPKYISIFIELNGHLSILSSPHFIITHFR